jgi:hypothetical protein
MNVPHERRAIQPRERAEQVRLEPVGMDHIRRIACERTAERAGMGCQPKSGARQPEHGATVVGDAFTEPCERGREWNDTRLYTEFPDTIDESALRGRDERQTPRRFGLAQAREHLEQARLRAAEVAGGRKVRDPQKNL